MTDEQKAALDALKKSVEGKPPPSSSVHPRTGKRTQIIPHAGNLVGDMLTVLGMVKQPDQIIRELTDGCRSVRDDKGDQAEVFNYAHQVKHLIEKAEAE